ncbi:MAG TPA: YtxH domain-containing protein [Terriglobia bacterium]|nr:YtxH domain-containing protein [Terriglobia bacterium]
MKAGMSFIVGVGVGVAVGMLYAPKSGKETQDILTQKARGGIDQVSGAAKKLQSQAGNLAGKVKGQATGTAEPSKEASRKESAGAERGIFRQYNSL